MSQLGSQVIAQEKLAPSGAPTAGGTGSEPVLVATIGSVSKLQKDVSYLAAAVGQPGAGGMFAGMSAMFTNGVDPSRPIGIIVPIVEQSPEPIVLIPTDDVEILLKTLEGQTGGFDKLDDGTMVISVAGTVIYVKQAGTWAVVTRSRDLIKMAPSNPEKYFDGMGNDYDLAFRLNMQLVPANARAMLIAQMRQGFEQAMARNDDNEAAAYAESTIEQLEMLINQTDELFFGWNTDVDGRQLVFDSKFTAVAGSRFAAMYGGQAAIPSRFASVIRPDAAVYLHGAASMGPEIVEQSRDSIGGTVAMLKNMLIQQGNLPEDQAKEIGGLIDRVADLTLDSIAEGKSDAGAVLLANSDFLEFAFGAFVADGNEVAQLAKDIAAKVQGQPGAPAFKFDIGKYNGVMMHRVEAEVPESETEARKVFGDVLKVHIGTSDDAVYLAMGDASVPLLKGLIDSGSTDANSNRPLSQGRIMMLPIVQYVQSVETNAVIDAMVEVLNREGLAGKVEFVVNGVANGQSSKATIGEGVLKAIGAGIEAGQQQARANAARDF
ncbi:MAG: hypothetical protein AAF989_16450 [Planctomycetota bacterium]